MQLAKGLPSRVGVDLSQVVVRHAGHTHNGLVTVNLLVKSSLGAKDILGITDAIARRLENGRNIALEARVEATQRQLRRAVVMAERLLKVGQGQGRDARSEKGNLGKRHLELIFCKPIGLTMQAMQMQMQVEEARKKDGREQAKAEADDKRRLGLAGVSGVGVARQAKSRCNVRWGMETRRYRKMGMKITGKTSRINISR